MKFPVINPGSTLIRETAFLPIPETVPASDIETREEVKILTGNKIHALKADGVFYVSPEYYSQIQTKTNESNNTVSG